MLCAGVLVSRLSVCMHWKRLIVGPRYGERGAAIGEEFLGRSAHCLIDLYADLAAIYGKMNKLGDAEAAARKCLLVATQKVRKAPSFVCVCVCLCVCVCVCACVLVSE